MGAVLRGVVMVTVPDVVDCSRIVLYVRGYFFRATVTIYMIVGRSGKIILNSD